MPGAFTFDTLSNFINRGSSLPHRADRAPSPLRKREKLVTVCHCAHYYPSLSKHKKLLSIHLHTYVYIHIHTSRGKRGKRGNHPPLHYHALSQVRGAVRYYTLALCGGLFDRCGPKPSSPTICSCHYLSPLTIARILRDRNPLVVIGFFEIGNIPYRQLSLIHFSPQTS